MTLQLPRDFVHGHVWIVLYPAQDRGLTDALLANFERLASDISLQLRAPVNVEQTGDDVELVFAADSWEHFRKIASFLFNLSSPLTLDAWIGADKGCTFKLRGQGLISVRSSSFASGSDLDLEGFALMLSPAPGPRGPYFLRDATVAAWLDREIREQRQRENP